MTKPKQIFLFEVKTPSLLAHIEDRKTNPFQAVGRTSPQDQLAMLVGDAGLTLPRDNPDFLLDAEKKLAQFNAVQDETLPVARSFLASSLISLSSFRFAQICAT